MKFIVDFDGTCVTHDFPRVGKDIGAVPVLKKLIACGHKIILFTMRSEEYLNEAVEWFRKNGIELFGINTDPEQKEWTSSPKAYGHVIIDDIALGVPLVTNEDSRPYVDWVAVDFLLQQRGDIYIFAL